MAGSPRLHRTQLVFGDDNMERIGSARVIIFGVGGVGSWCADSLVRSGVTDITIVDSDLVCITNVNRQLQATTKTVGQVKVEALKSHLMAINPTATVNTIEAIYSRATQDQYDLNEYDYVIDAIDSASPKVELIEHASNSDTILFSSMGAGCKVDASRIKKASLWKTKGCPLARFVRNRLRRRGFSKDVTVIYSDELLENYTGKIGCGTGSCVCPKQKDENGDLVDAHEWCSSKAQINGSLHHITGIFGFMLAGLVLEDIAQKGTGVKRIH